MPEAIPNSTMPDEQSRRNMLISTGVSVGTYSSAVPAGYALAGPSRGGFVTSMNKSGPTVAATTGSDYPLSTRSTPASPGHAGSRMPSSSAYGSPLVGGPYSKSVDVLSLEPESELEPLDYHTTPEPAVILPHLSALGKHPEPNKLVRLVRFLAKAVASYPFSDPSQALDTVSSDSDDAAAATAAPVVSPSPTTIYQSQSRHLSSNAPPEARSAILDLLVVSVEAGWSAPGGLDKADKTVFLREVRRWAEAGRILVRDVDGVKHWVLPDEDREGLVSVLASLTRGGRELADLPGLVDLLCTFVTDSLVAPPTTSPLFDPAVNMSFVRTRNASPSPHASSLALLTALHQFAAPRIYTASKLLALRTVLEIAASREEGDIGGGGETNLLGFLHAIVRYGVSSDKGKAPESTTFDLDLEESDEETESTEGSPRSMSTLEETAELDQVLREAVAVVARLVGCEGLVGVVEIEAGADPPISNGGGLLDPASSSQHHHHAPTRASVLPPLALDLMREFIRSPTIQALKSLRKTLVAPPPTTSSTFPRPPTPILLLVGTLRSLRKAFEEHSAELDLGDALGEEPKEPRRPSLLAHGLPYLWKGICRVLEWGSGRVDGEVLRLVEERLEAAERARLRALESGIEVGTREREGTGETKVGDSHEEWELGIEVLEKTKWHIGAWETKKGRAWVLPDEGESLRLVTAGARCMASLTRALVRRIDDGSWCATRDGSRFLRTCVLTPAVPLAAAVDEEEEDEFDADEPAQFTQRPDVLAAFNSLLRNIINKWREPNFSGPSERLFALLVSLAPHLNETYARILLEQCVANDLCLPSHPEWLERTQEVANAFYALPPTRSANGPRSIRKGATPATRKRAIELVASLHSQLRHLDSARKTLTDTIILPLLESSFEHETDAEVADLMLALACDVGGPTALEAVDESEEGAETEGDEDGSSSSFHRLRQLFVRTAKGRAVGHFGSSASAPSTPRPRRISLTSLSRYNKETSPSQVRSASASQSPMPDASSQPEPLDVSFLAITGLIHLFHFCLAQGQDAASEKAVIVFRDLLALLAPASSPAIADPSAVSALSLRTRLAILQWLVRLRADASHRIHWIKDVDITRPAKIISRMAVSEVEVEEPREGRVVEDGRSPTESRGRQARQASSGERSGSASRMRSSDAKSPSRRRGEAPPTPHLSAPALQLWTVPEALPFTISDELADSFRGRPLSSFDHNVNRDWTEEEDPGTGLLKVKEVVDPTAPDDRMVVLPISEYLITINHILQHDQEWELISYTLCHLPEQLSNKHFAAGPRASQQIKVLRGILCDGLRAGDRSDRAFPSNLPFGIKRAEAHAVAFQCLTAVIAYRSLFNKQQQDDIVETFMLGLGNPRDTAQPSIHALAIGAYELRASVTKHLAEIMRLLQRIISTADLGVHILEFIAGVGQEPSLYANFTEVDFQTVFGIALKYIQAHNDRLADAREPSQDVKDTEEAFSQYVFLLAYYSIAAWYMALRLSERPKYVAFLTRRLDQANEVKEILDESTEVCFDMIARYAYLNADPRPQSTPFDDFLATDRVATATSKTWLVGLSVITVKSLKSPEWVEVTVRRASGVVRMVWEVKTLSSDEGANVDLVAMYLRHRDATQVGIPSVVKTLSKPVLAIEAAPDTNGASLDPAAAPSEATEGAETTSALPVDDSTSTPVDEAASPPASNGETTAGPSQEVLTPEFELLSVEPSFLALELSSVPDFGATDAPIPIPSDKNSDRGLGLLDRVSVVDLHNIGVLYAGPGQYDELEILRNTEGSKAYIEFISGLGSLVTLKGARARDEYVGGLDTEEDIDGESTYAWDDDISRIVFHVATLMPTRPDTDPNCTNKKRHIGNDFVKVIYNNSGAEFRFDTLPGDFNFINIVIQPHTPAGNPWVGPGMTSNAEFFKVSMQRRPEMPEVGPLGSFQMVTGSSLPDVVRRLCLHANLFAQVWLSYVHFSASFSNIPLTSTDLCLAFITAASVSRVATRVAFKRSSLSPTVVNVCSKSRCSRVVSSPSLVLPCHSHHLLS